MRINRESIIVKIIFYNNIAIVLTAIAIAFITTFVTFQDMEAGLITTSREKISLLNKAKENYFSKIKEDLYEISRKERESETKKVKDYAVLTRTLRYDLLKKDYKTYYRIEIAIINDKGKVLGKVGKSNIFERENHKELTNLLIKSKGTGGLVSVDGKIFSKIIIPYKSNNKKEYLVAAVPLDLNFLQYLKNFIELDKNDKIFSVSGDRYSNGDFTSKDGKDYISKDSFRILNRGRYKYFYKKTEIEGDPYYVAVLSLKDYKNDYIGNFGVAISRKEVFKTKVIVGIFITFIVLLLIAIFTTIFTKLLRYLLSPLQDITEAAEKISSGEYDTSLDVEGDGEVRVLATSIKKMLSKLKENQKKVEVKNTNLEENLNKIITVEQLLLGIQIEDDVTIVVRKIMTALTSEMGLGFGRAMFFRYSRERNVLIGECTQTNGHIADSRKDLLKENKPGFNFQMNELKDVVPLIKIPFTGDNIASKSLKNKTVIYYNDKGYKYNIGNDLFKSLGLNNFLIFPVYNVDYYSGVIICDYFTKDKKITKADIELLKLLLMNVSVKLRNKINEEDKIDIERNTTISKISERFFTTRESSLNSLIDILEATNSKDDIDLAEIIKQLEDRINKIKKTNRLLLEYSNGKKIKKEKVNIEHLMAEVIESFKEDYKKELKEKNVFLSSFIGYTGDVCGDDEKLRKTFIELLKNAYDAVILTTNKSRKVNVIVTRDKYANKVKIDIIDNGIGMDEERVKAVQEPFISFKPDAPGLGIPFAIKVIKECNGVIKFESKENVGTTVKITLNLFNEELAKLKKIKKR